MALEFCPGDVLPGTGRGRHDVWTARRRPQPLAGLTPPAGRECGWRVVAAVAPALTGGASFRGLLTPRLAGAWSVWWG